MYPVINMEFTTTWMAEGGIMLSHTKERPITIFYHLYIDSNTEKQMDK